MTGALAFLQTHAATLLVYGPLALGAAALMLRGMTVLVTLLAVVALALGAGMLALQAGADPLGLAAAALMAGACALALLAAPGTLAREFDPATRSEALGLALMTLGAALGAALAQDLEHAVAFAAAGMIGAGAVSAFAALRDRAAALAAFHTVVTALCGLAVALSGAGLVTASTGADAIASLRGAGADVLGPVLLVAGLSVFAGLAPLHAWTAENSALAPHGVGAVVALAGRIGAYVVLVRVAGALIAGDSAVAQTTGAALAAVGAVSALVGAAQALGAQDLRRLAAHALTAQFGVGLISLSTGSEDGFTAALFAAAAGAVTTLALLVGATASRPQLGVATPIAALDGLALSRPLIAAALGVTAFGLTGAPLTAAFLGKWLSVEAALARGWYWAAAFIVATSLAAVFIAGQIVERLYFRERPARFGPPPAGALVLAPALMVSVAATLAFGWDATLPLDSARAAARALALTSAGAAP